MHFADLVLKEIAAEGLEGVTLERLWGYLSSEDCGFPFKLDGNSKQFIWEALLTMKCLSFYVNPLKDDLPGVFDRRRWLIDDDRGMFYETPAQFRPRKFYPSESLIELGSCPFYARRENVSDELRNSPDLRKLSNVEEKWGDLLVIVASQHERSKLLFGTRCHPSDVSIGTYVVLEAITRNRYNGLPTTVADGLGCCGLNASSIWYARQKLEALGLITSQPYISKFQSLPMVTGLLLHHWRYYRHFPFPNATLIKKVLQLLRDSPKKAHTAPFLRTEVGLAYRSFRRLLHFASRQGFITTTDTTLTEAYVFLKGKNPEAVTVDDLQMFAHENSLPRCGPKAPLVLVHLKNSANIEAWFASFGAVKGAPRREVREFGSEDEEDVLDEELETEPGDVASLDSTGASNTAPVSTDLSYDDSASNVQLPDTSITELHSKPAAIIPTLRACQKTLAMAPGVNGEESMMVQLARLMLPQEITMATVLKLTRLNYFFARRLLRAFENLCAVRTTKRSLRATFILCRQMMTDAERLEYMEQEKRNANTRKDPNTLSLQTQREKRRQFILTYLSEHRLIPSVGTLRQLIWDHEAAAGLTVKMDHKSLHRIIEEMLKAKLLVIHSVKSLQGELRFLCHPDIQKDDPLIISAIEQYNLELLKKRPRLSDVRTGDQILLNQDFRKLTERSMQTVTVVANLCPRLRRRLLIHEYLFYVLYVLPGDMEPVIPATATTPAVYHKEYSWRRYVGPLKPPDGMERGWFALNDALRSMPFGLYLHLLCGASLPKIMCRWLGLTKYLGKISAEELRELDDQLMIEREQDVPLAELLLFPVDSVQPPGGRHGRVSSWLFSITRVRTMLNLLEEMTQHNLVSLFDQRVSTDPVNILKVMVYLHRNGGLLDTRYSNPAHRVLTELEKCPFLRFRFETMSDVASYWQTCEIICRNTPLGHRMVKGDLDKHVPLPVERNISPWTEDVPNRIVDDGSLARINWPSGLLPEDYKPSSIEDQVVYPCGACGFNPSDYSYLSRNWDRKPPKTHGGIKYASSESDSDSANAREPSVWTIPSTDRVPVNPEEPFWQWAQRLFEDTDFQTGFEVLPNLGPATSDKPVDSRRAYGFFAVTSRYGSRFAEGAGNKVSEKASPIEGSSQSDSVSISKPGSLPPSHVSAGGKSIKPQNWNKRMMQKPRKPSRPIQRRRPLLKEDRRSSRFRNPRCVWSPLEDQLLAVCRVASLVIGGTSSREFLSVPYSTVRDVLHRYIPHTKPMKTAHAYARRMKFILVLRRSECTAVNILLARVSARPDLQRKYNYGRNRWFALCRDAPDTAEKVFHSVVDRIIAEFVPRLNQLRPEAKAIQSPSMDIPEEPVPVNLELPPDNEPSTEVVSPTVFDQEYRISGSRSEVEQLYSLFKLNEKSQSPGLPDVGKNRVAVVVYSLYNYAMSSFRFLPEPTRPFRSFVFSRVLQQYPRIQLGQTLTLLMTGKLATVPKVPTIQKNDRIFSSKRIKLTQRFLSWVWYELWAHIKHVCQSRLVWRETGPKLFNSELEHSSNEPLHQHSFMEHTSGGDVAFFLELMLQDQFLEFEMDFQVGSITFIRDATINEAVMSYESRYMNTGGSPDMTPTKEDTPKKGTDQRKSHSVIRRELLPQLQEIPACFHDRQFWLNAAYSNRFRWFENRLSFCDSRLILRHRPAAEDASRVQYLTFREKRQNAVEVVELTVHKINDRIVSSLDIKKDEHRNLPVAPELSSLRYSLEKFIGEGRFTGRTAEEIKATFGDTHEAAKAIEQLLETKSVHWFGSTVSRFVHRRYIRLWLIHLKPGNSSSSNTEDDRSAAQFESKGEESIKSEPSLEPNTKRPRLTSTHTELSSDATPSSSLVEPKHQPSESLVTDSELGFFFPECWCGEDGRPKPRALCSFLQALIVRLTDSGGTSLANFAIQYQLLFGQQAIRRLVFWLSDLGAIRLLRITRQSKSCLFSPPPTYSTSNDLVLATAEELTLIPTPNCISIVGEFCDKYLAEAGDVYSIS